MPTIPRAVLALVAAVLIFAGGGAAGRLTLPRSPAVAPLTAAAFPLPGAPVVLVDSTGAQQGGSANALFVNPLALNSAADSVSIEGTRNTYVAAFTLSPATTANLDFIELTSSSTLIDRLVYAAFYPECTAQATVAISLFTHTALNTGGTFTVKNLSPRSLADAASTSSILAYTFAPTQNGAAANIDLALGTGLVTTTTTAPTPIVFDYTKGLQQPAFTRANGTDALGFQFPQTACTGITFPVIVIVFTESAT